MKNEVSNFVIFEFDRDSIINEGPMKQKHTSNSEPYQTRFEEILQEEEERKRYKALLEEEEDVQKPIFEDEDTTPLIEETIPFKTHGGKFKFVQHFFEYTN